MNIEQLKLEEQIRKEMVRCGEERVNMLVSAGMPDEMINRERALVAFMERQYQQVAQSL